MLNIYRVNTEGEEEAGAGDLPGKSEILITKNQALFGGISDRSTLNDIPY
jgi:hypothetical protein